MTDDRFHDTAKYYSTKTSPPVSSKDDEIIVLSVCVLADRVRCIAGVSDFRITLSAKLHFCGALCFLQELERAIASLFHNPGNSLKDRRFSEPFDKDFFLSFQILD